MLIIGLNEMKDILLNTIKILIKTENLLISFTYVYCSLYRLYGLSSCECYSFTKFCFPTAGTGE